CQMARDRDFKIILIDEVLEKPERTLQKPMEIGTYYLRIRAMTPDRIAGTFSFPRTVKVMHGLSSVPWGVLSIFGIILLFLP
ncbi:MAG: hypothetical protein ABII96_03140, partial [Candidatus Zixiibacteriota bacterium]